MVPTLTIDGVNFTTAARAFAKATQRDVGEDMQRHSRTFARYIMSVTPPAQGTNRDGADAYRTGRFKIARQMSSIFIPVTLKHKRRERWPDVAGLYKANSRVLTNRIGYRINPGQKFYVDKIKFSALLKEKQSRVGRLSSGWMQGFLVLGISVQSWISRHGSSRGTARVVSTSSNYEFTMTNNAVPSPVHDDLYRRVVYATQYTANNIIRQTKAILEKNAARFF